MPINKDIALEIKNLFDNNTFTDLKRFLKKRQCLNDTNSYLMYLFHLVQSAGILTTSFAAGSNNYQLVWTGIGLNILASLIHIYEKLNASIMKKLMHDIKAIKDGTYLDEGELIDLDQKSDNDNKINFNALSQGNNPSSQCNVLSEEDISLA